MKGGSDYENKLASKLDLTKKKLAILQTQNARQRCDLENCKEQLQKAEIECRQAVFDKQLES